MTLLSDIDKRNQLRREAKLPQLDVQQECLRLSKVEAQLRYDTFAEPLRHKLWKAVLTERGKPSSWVVGMSWGSEIERRIRKAYLRHTT